MIIIAIFLRRFQNVKLESSDETKELMKRFIELLLYVWSSQVCMLLINVPINVYVEDVTVLFFEPGMCRL